MDFIAKVESTGFDGTQALEMLHRLYTLDYGSHRGAGSRAAKIADEYHPVFHLDYISIIGRPLQPITRASERFFDNVTVSFKDWDMLYASKHNEFPFDLEHRTFRLATAATRETWFIVMHPILATVEPLRSQQERLKKRAKSSYSSRLQRHHAQVLSSYIKEVFLSGELLGERVEPSWSLGSALSQKLTSNKWTTFQKQFVGSWPTHVERHSYDDFWVQNQPAFHAYDYGANIEIEVSNEVQTLSRETRLRPDEDSEDNSDSGGDGDNNYNHSPEERGRSRETRLRPDEDSESSSSSSGDSGNSHNRGPDERGDCTPRGEYQAVEGGLDDGELQNPQHRDDWFLDVDPPNGLYSGGLRQLLTELDQKYDLGNISSISYALAVDLHCLDANSVDHEQKTALCLLADKNMVRLEYDSGSAMTFYPMAFHPAYGNFSSPGPPRFLRDHVLSVMRDNMSFQNDGADVLSCKYFHAYSNIKRSIRYNPEDLLATQGIATAALTIPESVARSSARAKAKQQRLLQRLQGDATPNDPDASKPFARERQRIQKAVAEDEFAFRMEQVVSINVAQLVPRQRNLQTVLQPIFQLMRFYLQETQHYIKLLRCFRPTIFPQILGTFARVFELAMDEMLQRFRAQGCKGLGLALAEGVAALDRLGHYCFTGTPKVLVSSVLGPLKTMDSLRNGAWPYIDPKLLDLRQGEGMLDVIHWPRTRDGRPMFMHVASLGFHYGQEVAASRHSLAWFRDLGAKSISGPAGATRFLEELFHDLWIPQMVAYISHQLQRRLRLTAGGGASRAVLELREQQRALIDGWAKSEHPFAWRFVFASPSLSPLLANIGGIAIMTPSGP
jgi:hypothetical protein